MPLGARRIGLGRGRRGSSAFAYSCGTSTASRSRRCVWTPVQPALSAAAGMRGSLVAIGTNDVQPQPREIRQRWRSRTRRLMRSQARGLGARRVRQHDAAATRSHACRDAGRRRRRLGCVGRANGRGLPQFSRAAGRQWLQGRVLIGRRADIATPVEHASARRTRCHVSGPEPSAAAERGRHARGGTEAFGCVRGRVR